MIDSPPANHTSWRRIKLAKGLRPEIERFTGHQIDHPDRALDLLERAVCQRTYMLKDCVRQHFSRASSRPSVETEQESVDRVSTVIVARVKTLGGEFEVASPATLAPTNPLVGVDP